MISFLIVLVVIGIVLWLVETYIPMDPMIKTLIRVVVLIFVLLWILQFFGIIGGVTAPKLR